MDLNGITCPYCGQPFTVNDDVAVCPECGTPHHRNCYIEHGECANNSLHSSGFEWKNPALAEQLNKEPVCICTNCGAENKIDAMFCENCGERLNFRQPEFRRGDSSDISARPVMKIQLNEKIDGVPIKDYMVYLGRNALSFVISFKRQTDTKKKIGFNMACMLSPLFFFLYYRMWLYAAIIGVISFICTFPTLVVDMYGSLTSFMGIAMNTWKDLSGYLYYLLLVIYFICALYGTYLLRIDSSKRIKKIRRSCTNEEEYQTLLAKKACPSKAFMGFFIALIVFMLIALFTL